MLVTRRRFCHATVLDCVVRIAQVDERSGCNVRQGFQRWVKVFSKGGSDKTKV